MRYFTPTLFFGAAAYVGWSNAQGGDRVIAFSFLQGIMPESARDPASLGQATVAILLGIAAITLMRAVAAGRRARGEA